MKSLFLASAFLFLGCFNHVFACACDPVADSLELVDFYERLNGDNWTNNTNWLQAGKPISQWHGITVNSEGCVTFILLDSKNLDGNLGSLNLPELIYLDLSNNQIGGEVPDFLNSPQLKFIGLASNDFTGSIPDFSNCPELTNVDLSRNRLAGPIPDFPNSPKLLELNLAFNEISGEIPDFSNLPKLVEMDLSRNLLYGPIPDFSNTPSMETLNLISNQLSGGIPDFSNLPALTTLWLAANPLGGEIPDFSNIPAITSLVLEADQLSGEIPDFSNIPNLTYLKLSNNQLSGTIPDFSNLPKLTDMLLYRNQLSGEIPNFSNLPELFRLYLYVNQLSGEIPDFTNTPALGQVFLSFNQLSGAIPDFSNLPSLSILSLINNQLSGEIPDFSNSPSLAVLSLSTNQLSGAIPDFSSLPSLRTFNVSNNQLSGAIPNFSNLPSLRVFIVSNNQLSGAIPDFSNSPDLNYLSVDGNHFTFTTIIPALGLGISTVEYHPQQNIFRDTVIQLEIDRSLEIDLSVDSALTTNVYQWQKDSLPWAPPIGNDPSSNKLLFPSLRASDAGRYYAAITNSTAPDLTLFSNTISLQVCDEQMDSLELVGLYNATGGVNWTNSTNWLEPGQPISTWFGVSPDAFGCVRKLDLTGNNLVGSLPPLNLNTLDSLILGDNQLNGVLPEMETPFLKYLDLGNNQLTGGFPVSLLGWYDLRGLDLSGNRMSGNIPPDLGDLCEMTTLRLNNNQFDGELPEKLTQLFNLEIGGVDFSNNLIDSLKEKIIWFCPYGDTILEVNPSYDRFLGICNVQCSGDEWDQFDDFPWVVDTLERIDCNDPSCESVQAQAGFVDVRGVKVIFVKIRCYTSNNTYTEETYFYDCAGHLLETTTCDENLFCALFGAITREQFNKLEFDVRWSCGDDLEISTAVNEPEGAQDQPSTNVFSLLCSPNPTDLLLICEAGELIRPTSVLLADLVGRRFSVDYQLQGKIIRLDVGHLPTGMYVVSVQGENGRYIAKVAIK